MAGNKHDNGVHEVGTDEIVKSYQEDTPYAKVEKYIKERNDKQVSEKKKHFSQVFQNPLKGFPYNEEFEVHLKEASEEDLEENADASIKKKAEKTGMPFGILKKVYNRGVAAWKTGHRPGTTPEQWGHARVNSFATKSKGTWGGADKDLAKQVG
tara:strand:- start:581 stop:1042 length:462 start_codon:yes stop_codon:yes gene_type:complete